MKRDAFDKVTGMLISFGMVLSGDIAVLTWLGFLLFLIRAV